MADFLSPGVKVTEISKGPVAVPSTFSVGRGAFTGKAEKGPIDDPQLVFSLDDARELFGKNFSGSYLMESVAAFFQNGGESCYVNRNFHYTSVSAGTLDGAIALTTLQHGGAADTLDVFAAYRGVYANAERVTSTKVDTVVALALTLGAGAATVVPLDNVSRLRIGDTISIVKLTDTQRGIIIGIDVVAKTVTLKAAITVPAGGYTGAEVVTRETFDMSHKDADGFVTFTFRGLCMAAEAGARFVENIINNTSRTPIIVDSKNVAPTSAIDPRPANTTGTNLGGDTAGSDGGAVVDADYIGDASAKNGFYAFDDIDTFLMLSAPGITTAAVEKALQDYCEGRQDIVALLEVPQGTTVPGAVTFVQTTVNFGSSYATIYYPWVRAVDAETSVAASFPPTGYVQGVWARTFRRRNFGKAPAGIQDGQLLGVVGVDTEVKQPSYDVLYPAKINAIQRFEGAGFSVFGSRTLDGIGDFLQINVRVVFIVVKRQFRTGTRFANFENNDPTTRGRVTRYMTAYLRGLREAGILQGNSDDEAFFVICDESNNTPTVINQGKLKCRVGLAVQRPAEFIDITLEQDTRAIDAELASS